jgi:hypothetical protein
MSGCLANYKIVLLPLVLSGQKTKSGENAMSAVASSNCKSDPSPNDPLPNGPPPPYAPPNVPLVDKKDEKKGDIKSVLQAPYFGGALPSPMDPSDRVIFGTFATIGRLRINFNFGDDASTRFWSAIFVADCNRCVEKGYTMYIDAGHSYVKPARSNALALLLPTSMTRQSDTIYRAFVDYYWPIATSTLESDVVFIGPRKIYQNIQFDSQWTP